MAENRNFGLCSPNSMAHDPTHGWEHDVQLLNNLAVLSGMTPLNLLRKISWSVGESPDTSLFYLGQPLSAAVRARLQTLYKERMQAEYETIDNCRHASSQIVQLVPYIVGLIVISLLLFD